MSKKLFLGSECKLFMDSSGNRIYVCITRGKVNGHNICATGEAPTLEQAEAIARQKLDAVGSELANAPCGNFDYNYNTSFNFSASASSKDYLNGGGNKRASERQIDKIRKLAREHGTTAKDFVYEKCGKQLDQLVGSEADAIIKCFIRMEQENEFF